MTSTIAVPARGTTTGRARSPRRLRVAWALPAAAALVLLGSPAMAAPAGEAVPPAVATWFAQDAPRVAGDVLGAGAVDLGPARANAGYRSGTPVRLHRWNDAFVAGSSDQPSVASSEWVAPLYRDGAVVGTIAAAQAPSGQVAMTYVDDDATAGRALGTGARSGHALLDPRMGGLMDVAPDGAAKGLSAAAAKALPPTKDLPTLRTAVRTAHERAARGGAQATGGGVDASSGNGARQALGGAVALGGVGLVALGYARSRGGRREQAGPPA